MTDPTDPAGAAPIVEVLRGAPTPEELAAVIAVVSAAYADEAAAAVVEQDHRRSAWEVSARGMRAPLRRELGWSGFSG